MTRQKMEHEEKILAVVIDIPEEELYKIEHDRVITDEQRAMLFCAIKCGTVLPKGHGDLIDRSKLKIVNLGIGDYDVWGVEDYAIADAPTVIPADK